MPISALPEDSGYMGDRRRGAGLGRASVAGTTPEGARFYLRKERIDSGGYDAGGAYWGIGSPLYRYESEDGTSSGYFRANNRAEAKTEVTNRHPGALFFG